MQNIPKQRTTGDPRLAGHFEPSPNRPVLDAAQSLLDRRWPLAATSVEESVRAAQELFAMTDAEFAQAMAEQRGAA